MPVTDQQIAALGAAARHSRADRDAAILELGRQASQVAQPGTPFERKMRLCAHCPENEGADAMTKALASVEWMLLDADKPKPSGPANRPRGAATLAARGGQSVPPAVSTPTSAPRPATFPAPARAYRLGDMVQFQHGRVCGEGRIVASGRAGVTVQDRGGNNHQVRHEHVLPPAPKPAFAGPSQAERIGGRHAAESLAFYDFRDQLAGDIRKKLVRPEPVAIVAHAIAHYGLSKSDSAEWTEQFLASVGRDLERRAA